jgi:hypothetical protein
VNHFEHAAHICRLLKADPAEIQTVGLYLKEHVCAGASGAVASGAAQTAWKASAEAMREMAATLVESEQVPLQDNSNVRLQRAAAFIRTLPVPEEPKA